MADATDAPAPNATLYVQNLNERIKLPLLKQALEMLFSTYGPVLSVVAHTNLRMRGQAFVSFGDVNTATRALEEVNGFPLYGKGMVRVGADERISYAKTPSDSVVAAKNPDELPAHQAARKDRKRIWRRHNPQRLRAMLRHINAIKGACCADQRRVARRLSCQPSRQRPRHGRRRTSCRTSTSLRISCCSCRESLPLLARASSSISLARAYAFADQLPWPRDCAHDPCQV